MFSFFTKKPILKELIPQNAIDFHSHILYGLDDGAQNISDTQFLLESMADMGYTKLITSPHTTPLVWENTKENIIQRFEKVQQELPDLTRRLQLSVASEYLMDESFVHRFENESLLTIKDDYVLVEMSYINPPMSLYDILFKLISNGYQPVLAHPERYNFYKRDFDSFYKLKQAGCLFQLNLLSVTGYYGDGIAQVADRLLKEELYDFVSSDVHHHKHIAAFSTKVQVKNCDKLEQLFQNNEKFR